jgi:hypothetical protein
MWCLSRNRDVFRSLSDTKRLNLSRNGFNGRRERRRDQRMHIPAQLLNAKRTWQSVTQLWPVPMPAWSSGCQLDRWGWQTFAVVSCFVLSSVGYSKCPHCIVAAWKWILLSAEKVVETPPPPKTNVGTGPVRRWSCIGAFSLLAVIPPKNSVEFNTYNMYNVANSSYNLSTPTSNWPCQQHICICEVEVLTAGTNDSHFLGNYTVYIRGTSFFGTACCLQRQGYSSSSKLQSPSHFRGLTWTWQLNRRGLPWKWMPQAVPGTLLPIYQNIQIRTCSN